MDEALLKTNKNHGQRAKAIDIVLCHFGGPATAEAVAPFLTRLFSDPAIIFFRMPQWVRNWIARRIVRKRLPQALGQYRAIGFSPINGYTDQQAKNLEARLRARHLDATVHVVNQYTAPFATDVVGRLTPGSERYLLPLYPHFCSATTGSSFRELDAAHSQTERLPGIRVTSWWHNPRYLDYSFGALRGTIEEFLRAHKTGPCAVLFSAHSVPQAYVTRGDPYFDHIQAHAKVLQSRAEAWLQAEHPADAARISFQLTFQSRVGPIPWLKPATDHVIRARGKEGGHLMLVPLSFVSDHLETLFEIDREYRDMAIASGFASFSRTPTPNGDPAFTECLVDVLQNHGLN